MLIPALVPALNIDHSHPSSWDSVIKPVCKPQRFLRDSINESPPIRIPFSIGYFTSLPVYISKFLLCWFDDRYISYSALPYLPYRYQISFPLLLIHHSRSFLSFFLFLSSSTPDLLPFYTRALLFFNIRILFILSLLNLFNHCYRRRQLFFVGLGTSVYNYPTAIALFNPHSSPRLLFRILIRDICELQITVKSIRTITSYLFSTRCLVRRSIRHQTLYGAWNFDLFRPFIHTHLRHDIERNRFRSTKLGRKRNETAWIIGFFEWI